MAVNIDSITVSDYTLRAVAKELNEKLQLTPPIDTELSGELLKTAIVVASTLIWPEDELSEQAQQVITTLTGGEGERRSDEIAEDLSTDESESKHVDVATEVSDEQKQEQEKTTESSEEIVEKSDESASTANEAVDDTIESNNTDEETSDDDFIAELERKYPKLKPEWRYLVSLIEKEHLTKKEIIDEVLKVYPTLTKKQVDICVRASRNPKYTRLKYGYIEKDEEGKLYFKPFEGE